MAAPQSQSGIAEALEATASHDNEMRMAGEQHLRGLHDGAETVAGYLGELSSLLLATDASGGKQVVRHQAGMLLKNFLHAEDPGLRAEKEGRWHRLDKGVKDGVKHAALAALHSADKGARDTGAQLVSKVAHAEQPGRQWPEMVKVMLDSVTQPGAAETLREATLKALGYVCYEMNDLGGKPMDSEEVNNILTAIAQGMRAEEPSVVVRLAATKALAEALPFAVDNFNDANERGYIMEMIYQACECPGGTDDLAAEVRREAFYCLAVVAAEFYNFLPDFVARAFDVTKRAIEATIATGPDGSGEAGEFAAINAIEFWTVVAEIEHELAEEKLLGGPEAGEQLFHFSRSAAPALVPVLLPALAVQPERDQFDDSDWNASMAASTCLGALATAVGVDILPLVMPFISEAIQDQTSWQRRESSIRLFGCLLEAIPGSPELAVYLQGVQHLCSSTQDGSPAVVITALWCLGRAGRCQGDTLARADQVGVVVEATLSQIDPSKNKAVLLRACDTLAALCEGVGSSQPASLAPHLPVITHTLTTVLGRLHASADPGDLQLLVVAHAALQAAIEGCGSASMALVQHLMGQLVSLLGPHPAAQHLGRAGGLETLYEVEGECCGTVQVALQRLGNCADETGSSWRDALGMVSPDSIMEAVLRLLASRPEGRTDEGAMLVAGSLADLLAEDFVRYMDQLMPFVQRGLSNHADHAGFNVTIGVVGDLCRALGQGIARYAPVLMDLMYKALRSTQLHRSSKPLIFGCVGDMASALERGFAPYVEEALMLCFNASMHVLNGMRRDLNRADGEWFNSLRKSILDVYSALLTGMQPAPGEVPPLNADFYVETSPGQRQARHPAKHILTFIGHMHKRSDELADFASRDVDQACYGVLGDVVITMGRYVAQQLQADRLWIMDLLDKGQVKYATDSTMLELLGIARQALQALFP